jgi:hypothetical protein
MVAFSRRSSCKGNDVQTSSGNIEMDSTKRLFKDPAHVEADALKNENFLPSPEETIEALGIPEWRALEKQVVKRLGMKLMPCLWVLYLFNYLERASIA